jgi:CheY-like chemotaxis protein
MTKDMEDKKIDLILLIDDDEADNAYHFEVILEEGVATKVVTLTHADEVLHYFKNSLTEEPNIKFPVPDLILLDVLMPHYDAFEMLPHYDAFEMLDKLRTFADPYERRRQMKFVLMTGLIVPEVTNRIVKEYSDLVIACIEKPLKGAFLREIVRHLS